MSGPVSGLNSASGVSGGSTSEIKSTQRPYAAIHGDGATDTVVLSKHKASQKKGVMGSIFDIGKGIFAGAVNTIKEMFSWQGLLMTAGTLGLISSFGAAVVMPFLIGAGVIAGASQVLKGVSNGDWKKVGEGIFTLGATGLGAKLGPKEINIKGTQYTLAKTVKNQDGVITAAKPTGILDSTIAYLKAPFRGLSKVENGQIALDAKGRLSDTKGLMSMGQEHATEGLVSMRQKFTRNPKADSAMGINAPLEKAVTAEIATTEQAVSPKPQVVKPQETNPVATNSASKDTNPLKAPEQKPSQAQEKAQTMAQSQPARDYGTVDGDDVFYDAEEFLELPSTKKDNPLNGRMADVQGEVDAGSRDN